MQLFVRNSILCLMAGLLCVGCGGGGGGSSASPEDKTPDKGIATGSFYERTTYYEEDYGVIDAPIVSEESYTIAIKDDHENLIQSIRYTGPGEDGTWYTADDVVGEYSRFHGNQGETGSEVVSYGGMGLDGRWFTSDDIVVTYAVILWRKGDTARSAYYSDPGADGKWRTKDDHFSYYDETYNTTGRIIGFIAYHFGEDRVCLTDDDTFFYGTKNIPDASGNIVRELNSSDSGEDGEPFTSDDGSLDYTNYQYDDEGRLVKKVRFLNSFRTYGSSLGPDGIFLTDDDIPCQYFAYEFNTDGRKTGCRDFGSPGADGDWFTSDDAGYLRETYSYNPDGSLKEMCTYYNSNVDGSGEMILQSRTEHLRQLSVPEGEIAPDSTQPALINSIPADKSVNVSVGMGTISMTFSEDVIFYRCMIDCSGIPGLKPDQVILGFQRRNTLEVYLGNVLLKPHTTYSLTFTGLMDKTGNAMPTRTLTFTTGDADTAPPIITWSSLFAGNTNMTVQGFGMIFLFDEQVVFDPSLLSISPAIPGMSDSRVGFSDGHTEYVELDLTALTLVPNQTYWVTFTGVKDRFGNVMPTASFPFTTGN